MFGLKHIKFDSMTYAILFQKGKVVTEGRGLSFFYFAPKSSIVAIPVGSNDLPFIFEETTKDYQSVTIQGQISYRVSDPKMLSNALDFTVNARGQYKRSDPEKLDQRIINEAQTSVTSLIHETHLKDALRSAKSVEEKVLLGLKASDALSMLGIDILGVNVLGVSANPEMTRALETETREKLQKEADLAIYERRNFAVEQERIIRESELSTEIAVEEKKRQIAEKVMEADIQRAENDRKLREMHLDADIAVESQREALVRQRAENDRLDAETKRFVLEATLKPYRDMDWRILTALSQGANDPGNNIAMAFRLLAENADKIGTLNITPDLLDTILANKGPARK